MGGMAIAASAKIILLVEHNPDDAFLTFRALQKSGVRNEVVGARDSGEALEHLFPPGGRDANGVPQLVLLGLRLLKVDGLEVLRRLRADEQTKTLPAIIRCCSEVEACVLEADAYVKKPVDFTEFVEELRRLRHYWRSCARSMREACARGRNPPKPRWARP